MCSAELHMIALIPWTLAYVNTVIHYIYTESSLASVPSNAQLLASDSNEGVSPLLLRQCKGSYKQSFYILLAITFNPQLLLTFITRTSAPLNVSELFPSTTPPVRCPPLPSPTPLLLHPYRILSHQYLPIIGLTQQFVTTREFRIAHTMRSSDDILWKCNLKFFNDLKFPLGLSNIVCVGSPHRVNNMGEKTGRVLSGVNEKPRTGAQLWDFKQ